MHSLVLTTALWLFGTAHAAEPMAVDLEAAMARGGSSTPAHDLADARVEAAQAGVEAARGAWLPTMTLGADVRVWNSDISAGFGAPGEAVDCSGIEPPLDAICGAMSVPIVVRKQVTAHAQAHLVQPLTGLFAVQVEDRAARERKEAAVLGSEAIAAQASLVAGAAWLDAVALEQQVTIAESQVASLEARVAMATNTLEAHAATRSDVLLAEVALGRAREQLVRVEALRDFAYRRLASTIGEPEAEVRPTVGEVSVHVEPPPGREQLVAAALAHRPELAAMRAMAEAENEAARAADLHRLPTVSAEAAYFHQQGQGFGSLPNSAYVGARLDWTLFAGGRSLARVHAARATAHQASAELEQRAEQVRLEVERARAELTASLAAGELATQRLAQAEESLAAMEGRHAAGDATMTDLLSSETDVLEARTALVASTLQARRAELELEHAVGVNPWTLSEESP